jgi:hypothetical protein
MCRWKKSGSGLKLLVYAALSYQCMRPYESQTVILSPSACAAGPEKEWVDSLPKPSDIHPCDARPHLASVHHRYEVLSY